MFFEFYIFFLDKTSDLFKSNYDPKLIDFYKKKINEFFFLSEK